MITPAQWIHTMQQGTNVARAFVVEQARLWLTAHPPGMAGYSTTELSAALWPPHHAIGEAIELRKRMVDLLLKCARSELSDCASQGAPKKRAFMGKTARPWLWGPPAVMPATGAPIIIPGETRAKVIEAIRLAPAGQTMPAFRIGEIADVLLARARIEFKL